VVSLTTSEDQLRPARFLFPRVGEPFNENLILASVGAANPVITDVIADRVCNRRFVSGQRNQFNAGFQQALKIRGGGC